MIGDPPKPGGKIGKSPEDIHQEMLNLAGQFPKPSGNKLEKIDGWGQCRFLEK